MAIAITGLTSGLDTTTHPTVTASISPTSGAVVYVFVAIAVAGGGTVGSGDSLSVSGAGLTWNTLGNAGQNGDNRRKLFVVRGTGTPSAGALTITFTSGSGGTWTETGWSVVEATGLDGTTPNGTVYTATTGGATALSVTVSETPDAGDFVLAGFTIESNDTTPTRNSELDTTIHSINGGSDIRAVFTAYDSAPDSTPVPGITWTGTNSATALAFIVNAGAGGGANNAGPLVNAHRLKSMFGALVN